MLRTLFFFASILLISGFLLKEVKNDYITVWYINLDEINSTLFLEKVIKYPPDLVLLTIYSADDYYAVNDTRINLTFILNTLENNSIDYYFGFSLFSHPDLVAKHPEFKAVRKPVEGYYTEPGSNTSVCPLYTKIQEDMIGIINETIEFREPKGLVFDHTRFFAFDEGYNPLCKEWILTNYGLNLDSFTPTPVFILNQDNGSKWTKEDRVYYDSRADLIYQCTKNITKEFSSFELFGTTMGFTEPGRSDAQYVELQGNIFDRILLMAYDNTSSEISRNVRKTKELSKKPVILGLHPFMNETVIFNNIRQGINSGASGIYLLGFNFTDSILEAVSKKKIR